MRLDFKQSCYLPVTLALATLLWTIPGSAQFEDWKREKAPQYRDLSGEVLSSADQPIEAAIVYLTDLQTHLVKSFVTGKEGGYRFPGLSRNEDYTLYAEHQGHKSEIRKLSSLDSRLQVTLDLRIAE